MENGKPEARRKLRDHATLEQLVVMTNYVTVGILVGYCVLYGLVIVRMGYR
jgi:hypothetical protein